jgi:CheY-like chemotaxis protein
MLIIVLEDTHLQLVITEQILLHMFPEAKITTYSCPIKLLSDFFYITESADHVVIVSDYHMPGMNGLEFLEQLYASKNKLKTNGAIVSAFLTSDSDEAEDAFNNGRTNFVGFIRKPPTRQRYMLLKEYIENIKNQEIMNEINGLKH